MAHWYLITEAEIEITKDGALLKQDGKELYLTILSPQRSAISVEALYSPPLPYDVQRPGLKRIALNIPAYVLEESEGRIKVVIGGRKIA